MCSFFITSLIENQIEIKGVDGINMFVPSSFAKPKHECHKKIAFSFKKRQKSKK